MDPRTLILCFVPLFVAIDPVGLLPVFLGVTGGLSAGERLRVVRHSLVTATLVGFVFLLGGRPLFNLLAITESDFKIAGGLVLLVYAIVDLLTEEKVAAIRGSSTAGVVPLGVPLIAGPASITTLVMLSDQYHLLPTLVAFILNMGLLVVLLKNAQRVVDILGPAGTKGLSKVVDLILAAIAVMMIRVGVQAVIAGMT